MMFRLLPVSIRSALFFFAAGIGRGEELLEINLVSEVESIQPGQPFYVGLHLHHAAGYHSYWKFPGVVGVPTKIEWQLPDGFTAGEIEWPEPQSVKMAQIKAQGFERDVLLPIKITPPANLKAGQVVQLRGNASWMVCAQRCNPGFAEVRLELPGTPGNINIPRQYRKHVGLVEAPGPHNKWRSVVLRVFGNGRTSVVVQWWPHPRQFTQSAGSLLNRHVISPVSLATRAMARQVTRLRIRD